VSANPPIAAEPRRPGAAHRFRWAIWAGAALAGLAIAAAIAVVADSRSSPAPAASSATTFAAGERPAPVFSLVDQHGTPFSLASYHGRPVIVTFIDPLCRDFCPREASVLTEAAAKLGVQAPAIVSVSVNPWADTPANFAADAVHWQLAPGWRWGTASYGKLATIWKNYDVAVSVTKKTVAGIPIRRIVHTGAAYLVDANGDERALWLYPFTTDDVVSTSRQILGS
jgi:cytochrome oxidase Cu insertion factor (SCO1/SenC/PrrC family)